MAPLLVLPPTVVGFGLLISRDETARRSDGRMVVSSADDLHLVAAVIAVAAAVYLLMHQTFKAGFESVNRNLEDAARSMGAGEGQTFGYVTLPLSWRLLLTGTMPGFARDIGEFGATLMTAGNIPGETQTIPTAIYIAVENGNMDLADFRVIAVALLSFALPGLVQRLKRLYENTAATDRSVAFFGLDVFRA